MLYAPLSVPDLIGCGPAHRLSNTHFLLAMISVLQIHALFKAKTITGYPVVLRLVLEYHVVSYEQILLPLFAVDLIDEKLQRIKKVRKKKLETSVRHDSTAQ